MKQWVSYKGLGKLSRDIRWIRPYAIWSSVSDIPAMQGRAWRSWQANWNRFRFSRCVYTWKHTKRKPVGEVCVRERGNGGANEGECVCVYERNGHAMHAVEWTVLSATSSNHAGWPSPSHHDSMASIIRPSPSSHMHITVLPMHATDEREGGRESKNWKGFARASIIFPIRIFLPFPSLAWRNNGQESWDMHDLSIVLVRASYHGRYILHALFPWNDYTDLTK